MIRRTNSRNFPTFSRSMPLLLRFLPLLLLASSVVIPARADGVSTTIGNCQTVSGSVMLSGVDAYTFQVNAGQAIFVSISEVGTHTWDPEFKLYNPGGKDLANTVASYNGNLKIMNAAAGTWTVKVSVWQSKTGGSYQLKVITIPGVAGAMMSPGTTYNGSISRGDVTVYTFNGVAGRDHMATLKVTRNSGTFEEAIRVFRPDGSDYGGTYGTNFTYNVVPSVSGTYTVLVYRWGFGDSTDSYSISVSGNGVGPPPQPVGSCCGIRG